MGANDPFAPPTSPRPRRAPGVRPHPHDLLQEQPVATGMFDERAGDNAAPKLSGGLSLGPLSSRRIQVSVCCRARKTHLRFTYKGWVRADWPASSGSVCVATTPRRALRLLAESGLALGPCSCGLAVDQYDEYFNKAPGGVGIDNSFRTNTQQRIGAYSWQELITHPEKTAAAAAATAHWLQVDLHVARRSMF